MLKRQLPEQQKQIVLQNHGLRCFVDGAPFQEGEEYEFHHIKPYSKGGETSIDNIAPVCKKHHSTIRTMSLQEYRDKLDLGIFFENNPKYLTDLIEYKVGHCGEKLKYEVDDGSIKLYLNKSQYICPLHVCPTTGWKYLYATLPIEYFSNDVSLQPRALREVAMWNLYRHFQKNTQLSPSICRIDEEGNLLLFDGQHKAAAQIWSGREKIECKIYLNPDERILKETNLEAHGTYRQMSFYSHELMKKYSDIFGEDWTSIWRQTERKRNKVS